MAEHLLAYVLDQLDKILGAAALSYARAWWPSIYAHNHELGQVKLPVAALHRICPLIGSIAAQPLT
jgi:hypothetical protein